MPQQGWLQDKEQCNQMFICNTKYIMFSAETIYNISAEDTVLISAEIKLIYCCFDINTASELKIKKKIYILL